MTINLDLTPGQEAAIRARAEARGITVDQWLMEYIGTLVPRDAIAHLQRTNPEEWIRRFREWAESHDSTLPLLPDEAFSRESIYEERP